MLKFIYSFIAVILFLNISTVQAEEVRMSGMTVTGKIIGVGEKSIPKHLSPKTKKAYPNWDFNPKTDPQFYKYRHPQQWNEMAWDTNMWPEGTTDESVLKSMYSSDIFRRQYTSSNERPVVEVGPIFYKLSDLDKRRSLKLLSDYFEFFETGMVAFEVRDWRESVKIGEYTRYGFQPE